MCCHSRTCSNRNNQIISNCYENFYKKIIANAISAFIIYSIFEIIYDLLTGVTLAEMMSVKYIVIKLICTILFAIVFVAVFKLLNLPLDPSKKGKQ